MDPVNTLAEQIRGHDGPERRIAIAKLMQLAREEETRTGVFQKLVELVNKGDLTNGDLAPHLSELLAIWKELYDRVAPLQQDPQKLQWMFEDEYQVFRTDAEWLLDLLGYLRIGDLRGEAVADALRQGLTLSDPLLKLFAAISLLRHLERVDATELEKIAASHQTRKKLWDQLRRLHLESLMPERWSMPELLAASELSNWASHPMELGVPPEEIELAKIFPVEINGEKLDTYLFRFREYPKRGKPDEGWMAGIAGPYKEGQALLSPWSSFDQWDALRPEEHFWKLYSVVNR